MELVVQVLSGLRQLIERRKYIDKVYTPPVCLYCTSSSLLFCLSLSLSSLGFALLLAGSLCFTFLPLLLPLSPSLLVPTKDSSKAARPLQFPQLQKGAPSHYDMDTTAC